MINATCSDDCSVDLFWVLFRATPLYKFIIELARISVSLSLCDTSRTTANETWVSYPTLAGFILSHDLVKYPKWSWFSGCIQNC